VVSLHPIGYTLSMDIWERIRYARDKALEAEETERQRLAEADTEELQRAASVRLATRQSVREALDDVLDESSEPKKGHATSSNGDSAPAAGGESTGGEAPAHVAGGGEATAGEGSSATESGLSADPLGDVAEDPGSQISG
jgi:hypothetical protein